MRYKLRKENIDFSKDILTTILENRGIKDTQLFLNPDSSSDSDLDSVTNLGAGIELIKNTILKNGKILILVDSDCDGMTSGAMMYKYLREIYKEENISYFIHAKKEHGLTEEFMKRLEKEFYDLIIVPDAGSNDVEQIEKIELVYKSNVLVIDHHEVEVVSDYGVIINNQTCPYTNSNLSGAGMVFLLCKKLEMEFNTGILNELSNLATMGLIGDSCNLVDNEIRNICLQSLKNIENKFMNVANKHRKKGENIVISDLSYMGVIPLINSVVRVGTLEERILLFEALADIDVNRTYIVKKRKLNKETRTYETREFKFNLYQYVIDICEKAKSRQDSLVKKTVKSIKEQYDPSCGIQLFIIGESDKVKGITGLIANNLSEEYGKPAIVCWKEDNICKGSLRGNEKVMSDFKEWCINTGLFELVQGHANAAGVKFKIDYVDKIKEEARSVVAQEACCEVDKIYKQIIVNDIFEVDSRRDLWSKGCERPVFAIEDIVIGKSNIFYSKRTLRLCLPYVTLVKFNASQAQFDDLMSGFDNYIKLNVIGEFSVNEWNNKKYPQVLIKDFEVIKRTENEENYGIFN